MCTCSVVCLVGWLQCWGYTNVTLAFEDAQIFPPLSREKNNDTDDRDDTDDPYDTEYTEYTDDTDHIDNQDDTEDTDDTDDTGDEMME